MSAIDCRRNNYWYLGLTGIGLLSAYLFLTAVTQTVIPAPIRGDARDYVGYALNLQQHGIYSRSWPGVTTELPVADALRAPGYPFFVSFFLTLHDNSLSLPNLLIAQAVLGVLTVLAYLALFRRIMPTPWALAAGLCTAISPHLINASVYYLTETLFTCLLGLHLLTLDRALRKPQALWLLAAGTLLAASLLVRPTTQYLIFVYAAILLVGCRDYPLRRPMLLWLILPVVIAVSGWSARNLAATGRTSDPTLSANFLQHGMYINMMYENRPETFGYPYRFDPQNEELSGQPGKVLAAIAQRFGEEPRRYLAWYLIGKPIEFFAWNLPESIGDAFVFEPERSPYFEQALFQTSHDIAETLHPLLMLLGIAGAYAAAFRQRTNLTATLLGWVLLYFIGLHMIGAPFPRYSIPVRPIVYGLAFFLLHAATQWLIAKRATVKQTDSTSPD